MESRNNHHLSANIYGKNMRMEIPEYRERILQQKKINKILNQKPRPSPSQMLEMNQIDHILVVSGKKAWVSEKRHLALVKANGKIEKYIKLDCEIQALAFNEANDLIVETATGIRKITENGKIVSNINDKSTTDGETDEPYDKVTSSTANVITKIDHSGNIDALTVVGNNAAWIANDSVVELIKSDGEVEKSMNLGFKISGLAIHSSSDNCMIVTTGKTLKKVSVDTGEITDFGAPFLDVVSGFTITQNGDLLVCVGFQVIRLSLDGTIKQTIHQNGNGGNIFSNPLHVTETINSDIWVCDLGTKTKSVIALNRDGIVKFNYCGPSKVTLKNPFNPSDLLSNKLGHVLISDFNNDAIHLVDQDGHFVQFILTSKNGLTKPCILSQDKDGTLWVVCSNNSITVTKYLSDDKSSNAVRTNTSACCTIL